MRWSLRRAAKTSVLLIVLTCMCFILLETFDVGFYRRKLSFESLVKPKDNGRPKLTKSLKPVDSGHRLEYYQFRTKRKQRSAKSLTEESEELKYQTEEKKAIKKLVEGTTKRSENPGQTELGDIFIGVKTSKKFHSDRLQLLVDTWIALAKEQTYIFTDGEDQSIQKSLPSNHLINTNCSTSHNRKALCCKMAVEYDYFISSGKRWFCHVDDDNYVNIPQLVNLLKNYNHLHDWYIGKPSLQRPIEIMDKNNPGKNLAFWFATGGAGFCISRGLAMKMLPHAGGGRFMATSELIRLPDDCTIGFIINHILNTKLTVHNGFHSHLEPLTIITDIHNQITFSYMDTNRVQIQGAIFDRRQDRTRFKSIHCKLFPNFKMCQSRVS